VGEFVVFFSVRRNVLSLDFNRIPVVPVHSMESLPSDSYRLQISKMRYQQYRQIEA